jgi:hypothetical protein
MLDNRLQPYFPLSFRWLGFILLPLGIIGIFPAHDFLSALWPAFSVVAGTAFIWTFHGTQIDLQQNRVMEYVSVVGLRLGSWSDLPKLEKIFVTKTNYSQVIWSRVSSTQERSTVFRAYLKGPGDFKLLFSEKKEKESIVKKAGAVANGFDLQILDCTVKPPTWI